jgi:hypothetical protein
MSDGYKEDVSLVDIEMTWEIADAIAISEGQNPLDYAPLMVMCTAENKPVPWRQVYYTQAEAAFKAIRLRTAPAGDAELLALIDFVRRGKGVMSTSSGKASEILAAFRAQQRQREGGKE